MTQTLADSQESRRTAVAVNIAKIALLAALAPPVIAGIAERASTFDEGTDVAALVAYTVSLGAISAVIGALGLGALADLGRGSITAKWGWVTVATAVGTTGLMLLALSPTQSTLIAGWVMAQLGYSGAMAVLRAILAHTLPTHRRRGAVVVVLGSYGGLFLPVVILLFLPDSIWVTTFVLAIASLLVPAVFLFQGASRKSTMLIQRAGQQGRFTQEPDPVTGPQNNEAHPSTADSADTGLTETPQTPLPRIWLLLIQCASNIVITVFLTYHPLELASRATDNADFPVRASVWVVAMALMGLVTSTSILLWKPKLLANSVRVVSLAGFIIAVSLVLRSLAESTPVIALAAILSGAAVGLNSSALFSAALDAARNRSGGKLMGLYSAAGALGQFVGPMIALAVLKATTDSRLFAADEAGYRTLFLFLAAIPLTWAIGCALKNHRHPSHPIEPGLPLAEVTASQSTRRL